MSRVGKMPIELPSGVVAQLSGTTITVNGPKGSLQHEVLPGIEVELEGQQINITRRSDEKTDKANHGLTRALVNNMVTGVSQGYEKKLEINGVGYKAQVSGTDLKLSLGFSHETIYKISPEAQVSVEQNVITVQGISKQKVGQVAAEIRALKKPEPYKGKGIKYADEKILRKSGKSGKE